MNKAAQILAKRKSAAPLQELLDPNFPQQNAFITDSSRLKALFCTRRAAKSYTGGLYLVKTCLENPGVNCLFIGLTRDSASDIIVKDILKTINTKHNLQMRFRDGRATTVTFANGSVIRITGVDADENEMNKLLGKKYKLVVLDEASVYSIDLRRLIYGVLKPTVTDQGGTICMLGTASNFPRGLFFDITTGVEGGWSLHQWNAFDNPHVAEQWANEIAEIERDRPLFKETTLYQQWYLNKWVVDTDKLVYKFSPERNLFLTRPPLTAPGWSYVLGVDTGWEDDNAFVLVGFHEHHKVLYVIKTFNAPHMTFDQVVAKINEFMGDSLLTPCKVVIDGANKQGVESMKTRSSIPFEYADKQGKGDFIELLNADLVQGLIKIDQKCDKLVHELNTLVWKTEGDRIVYPRKEHPALPNHLCDAFLYAWRNGWHYQATAPIESIPVGSNKWYAAQAEHIWERERERLEAEANATTGGWSTDGGWGNL